MAIRHISGIKHTVGTQMASDKFDYLTSMPASTGASRALLPHLQDWPARAPKMARDLLFENPCKPSCPAYFAQHGQVRN